MTRRFALIFVCQHGRLEAQACLLAASLRKFARFDCDLIAAIPEPAEQWGKPTEQTLALLGKLGVRTVGIHNEIDPAYAIGNKIACLSVATTADKLILIDSDMILIRPWEDDARFAIGFNARPASVASFTTNDADWDSVYAACGTSPLRGLVRTTVSGQLIHPYFNSAFVAVPGESGFGKAWLDCCRKIDAITGLPKKRPHLDQIALSPAVAKLGLEYDCLDETYNHPINFKPMDADRPPLFCHYHNGATLAREPLAVRVVRDLIATDSDLAAILSGQSGAPIICGNLPPHTPSPFTQGELWGGGSSFVPQNMAPPSQSEWQDVCGPAGEKLAVNGQDLLITGIPRSGTSLLCSLLHRHDNCVVLNEPPQIIPALSQNMPPWALARFFRETRRAVLLGHEIENKLINEKVTEDTAQGGSWQRYRPQVGGGDFVLGMKATIPLLSRLRSLRQTMPHARIVACVRNPFDTIASWKTTFPHLRDADIRGRPIGGPLDPWITARQRAELEQIADIKDIAVKRAAWWRYLAELILEEQANLILVRYEELVRNPLSILEPMIAGCNPGRTKEPILESEPRRKTNVLDAEDVIAIRALCSDAATRLNVFRVEP